MTNSLLSIIPPIAVLIIALVSRNVIFSLSIGVISAGLLATNFSLEFLPLVIHRMWNETDIAKLGTQESADHVYTFLFLIILGIIISLITHVGGMRAYSKVLAKRIKNKTTVESTSLLLSLFFFIDDYLSSLTVGSIMRPLTDKFLIPRAKLAFLLDSMSAPLCVLIPASSWVAFIIPQIETAGINVSSNALVKANAFDVYIHTIPYMLYPLLLVISAWLIIRHHISFGSMRAQEIIAEKTGNLFGGKPAPSLKLEHDDIKEGSIYDFIVPIIIFLCITLGTLLYSGNSLLFGGSNNLLVALQNAQSLWSLFVASSVTLPITLLFFFFKQKVTFAHFLHIALNGFLLMKNSLLVLLLAWTFSSLLKNDLGTGHYVAQTLLGTIPVFLVPAMVFITACITAASTGSAWGTIAIIIPLAIPFIANATELLYPILGGLISGAIAGGHISPISDSTVMSSTSSGCYHIDHITTQIGYVTPALIATLIALLVHGSMVKPSYLITFAIAFTITVSILLIRNKLAHRRDYSS